ncbi:MAG TPA: alpha/beta hydrolase [Vicinamibacterales bacterium]|nr:alpha/beta hydrolase [Vicinamibacterales bacterium]
MAGVLRFAGGVLFLAAASLTLLPALTRTLWYASLAATEWGYFLAFAAVLPLIPTRARSRLGTLGALLAVAAMALFVSPVIRAQQMGRDLPAAFDTAFGAERRARGSSAEDPRPAPLVLMDLFRPPQSQPIRFETREYARYAGEPLTLDVYQPGYAHGPLPGVIVVPGGTWRGGDNSEFVAFNAYLAARDYVVLSINRRLAPRWPFPAARDDVLSALAFAKVNGPQFGIDPDRIVLLGRSAGGELALLAAYTAGDPAVRGVVSIYGGSDLQYEYEHPAPSMLVDTRTALEVYLGGPPAKREDAYFAASPINFVSAASPPTLLIQGALDRMVTPEETARLETRLRAAGVKHLTVNLPWATHKCDKSFAGPCGQMVTYAVERFLDGVTIPPEPQAPQPHGAKRRSKTARR